MNKPILSIITPCYNHGIYLDEMLESVHNYSWSFEYEHILINDGSTDQVTKKIFKKIKEECKYANLKIIEKSNSGLAHSRNIGLNNSNAEIVFILDSDNTIIPSVIEKCILLMLDDSSIDAAYTDFYYMDSNSVLNKPGLLDLQKLIFNGNYIDACALFKKSSLIKIGGYDSAMPNIGHEDWDVWVHLGVIKAKCIYINEIGFNYRVSDNSMIRKMSSSGHTENHLYIINKYFPEILYLFKNIYEESSSYFRIQNYLQKNKIKSIIKIILNRGI
jgi:glycosyltransferase involved in cell wall biosynthesis